VDRIRPSIQGLLGTNLEDDPEALMRAGVRANVRSSVAQLRSGSQILEALVQKDRLNVVGAEYSLSTGLVEFFEGVH
jgi:carbonic anhydrase